MRITSAGDVGIGTNNPSAKLHVYDADNNALLVQTASNKNALLSLAGDRTWQIINDGASTIGALVDSFHIYDVTASAARLTITTGGNVAI